MIDSWNPQQYDKFKDERSQPFWDLLALIQPTPRIQNVLDLGCGTGALTAELHSRFESSGVRTLGIDNSSKMLEESKQFSRPGLTFALADIASFAPSSPLDLLFSNAALQWVPDHESIFPKILGWVSPHGQVAIQMPYNQDHFSHRLAHELAREYSEFQGQEPTKHGILPQERYAEILYQHGFKNQKARIETYLHPMESGTAVVEWTKGTLLTRYQKKLSPEKFTEFVAEYQRRVLQRTGPGPYLYTFKRILLWGTRA